MNTNVAVSPTLNDRFHSHFVLPDREKSFAAIHKPIFDALRSGRHVLLVQIDGLGFDQACAAIDSSDEFLTAVREAGSLDRWSAQWPATTTVQMTTLFTGMPVEEHGLLEWVIYEPKLGKTITPLMMSNAREGRLDSLVAEGVSPHDILPHGVFFPQVRAEGFGAYIIAEGAILRSSYNATVCNGASMVPFENLDEGCQQARKILEQATVPSCIIVYTDILDKTNHLHTKYSVEHRSALKAISESLSQITKFDEGRAPRECEIMITADHGHMTVDPERTVYLNDLIPNFDTYLQRAPDGAIIPCSGGFRSLFLHSAHGLRAQLLPQLQRALRGRAEIFKLEELFELGVFRFNLCSEAFWEHAGDLVILPFAGESVSYRSPHLMMHKRSVHGGCSKEEMETPMFRCAMSRLQEILDMKER